MKQNIFAAEVPKTVDLPFATITFMSEPVKSDVTSVDDLPNVVMSMVDHRSATVYQFYMKVARKDVPADDLNLFRAEDLIQEEVMTAIRQFGDTNQQGQMDFEPNYPMMAYEVNAPRPGMLRPDAHRQFFLELVSMAVPGSAVFPNPLAKSFGLTKNEHGTRFNLGLAPGLELTVSTQEIDAWGCRHRADDPQFIYGTCKLLGQKAYLMVGPANFNVNPARMIRNWLTHDVLHDSIQQRLQDVVAESFGPLGNDLLDELLDGIAFDLL